MACTQGWRSGAGRVAGVCLLAGAASAQLVSRLAWTERISNGPTGAAANHESNWPTISADGRYVGFFSSASDLVPDDTNGVADVFVYDAWTGAIERASVGPGGEQAEGGESFYPILSPNGRVLLFFTASENLSPNDAPGLFDAYLRDLDAQETHWLGPVNAHNAGSLSLDGRFVAFATPYALLIDDFDNQNDVHLLDRQSGALSRVSVAPDGSDFSAPATKPDLSSDGRWVAFDSPAALFPWDTNGVRDVFLMDTQTQTLTQVSRGLAGASASGRSSTPSLSGDGRFVCFQSFAGNLVPGDDNDARDIFVYDHLTGVTERVSLTDSGAAPGVSDMASGTISLDGRFVVFCCTEDVFSPRDSNGLMDIFVRDRMLARTTLESTSSAGAQGEDISWRFAISASGRFVAFSSLATAFGAGDGNGQLDVFLRDRGAAAGRGW